MIAVLFVALAVLTLIFIAFWIVEARRRSAATPDPGAPNAERVAVGFFANFFDALGIGSFATSTTYFRLRKLVRDELIPGTLNVGHCLPTATQAFIGIAIIAVDPLTLVLMIVTAVLGAWFGAGVVSRMPRRAIQVGMGVALLVAAGFLFAKAAGFMPSSNTAKAAAGGAMIRAARDANAPALASLPAGAAVAIEDAGQHWSEVQIPDAFALNAARATGFVQSNELEGLGAFGVRGSLLAVALGVSFFLGAIMPLGIGYYAPCMILISLLGMNIKAAFPIMMGACAFLMPMASMQFVRKDRYSLRAAAGLAIGGIFGSALALLVVKSLNLTTVMWLVTAVVVYTGISLLVTASREARNPATVATRPSL